MDAWTLMACEQTHESTNGNSPRAQQPTLLPLISKLLAERDDWITGIVRLGESNKVVLIQAFLSIADQDHQVQCYIRLDSAGVYSRGLHTQPPLRGLPSPIAARRPRARAHAVVGRPDMGAGLGALRERTRGDAGRRAAVARPGRGARGPLAAQPGARPRRVRESVHRGLRHGPHRADAVRRRGLCAAVRAGEGVAAGADSSAE
jgi:hypothetical protein